MALSPVSEESPNYEEVLQKSDSLSAALQYSGDTFESISDKSNARYIRDAFDSVSEEHSEKYRSDSFEVSVSESSHQQRSDSFSPNINDSSRNYEDESFESLSSELDVHHTYSSEKSYVESASVEDDHMEDDQGKGLIEKWIKTLRDENLQPNNPFHQQHETVVHEEPAGIRAQALQSFCALKIKHLRQPPKNHRHKKDKLLTHPRKAISICQSCPVPQEMMSRLELQLMTETINQVIRTEMHDPAACPDCCKKRAELAKCQFIRLRKTKLEADLLHKKLEEDKCSKDLVTFIGEILQTLPKPSEDRAAVWQRLSTSVTKT
ncbi:LOW QUALITY PROTEIN: uncharacterized protein C8orf48 homolog [Phyllobates terribilis]|uniref:LOW QUALITY PROTEIN: uncharacterized protein C8orf48 homolog n=1 Tax=Phyllobates terribilis TaxID=111132 RepID=UPI003CCA7EE4